MITVLVFIIAVSAWFFLYTPNHLSIRDLLVQNAILQANARISSVLALVDRCREGAASLSSRTMLRRSIREYHDGKRTLAATRISHEGLYDDGARVLVWLSGSVRCVDGQIVASFGKTESEGLYCNRSYDSLQIFFNFADTDKFILGRTLGCAESLRIVSPIIQDGIVLGHDLLCFSLNDGLASLQDDNWKVAIVSAEQAALLRNESDSDFSGYSDSLFRVMGSIGVVSAIPGSSSSIMVCTDYDKFFAPGFRIIRSAMIRFLAILVLLLATSNIFIVYILHRLLKKVEASRDKWRETSMRDSLTGLYSRRSLDLWMESELGREMGLITVIMIDLDGFKEINDTLGHDAGDAVLASFAPLVQTVLRSDDIAIRYGGDEFLLILRNSDDAIARTVMARLEESLESLKTRDHSIVISWGMETLQFPTVRREFEVAIQSADEAMYRMKRKHRASY